MLEFETSLKNSISLTSGDIKGDSNACTKVRKQELRNASKTHTSLDQTSIDMRTSLQQCELQGLAFLLNNLYEEAKRLGHRKKQQKLRGILEIHSHLLLKPDFGNADTLNILTLTSHMSCIVVTKNISWITKTSGTSSSIQTMDCVCISLTFLS